MIALDLYCRCTYAMYIRIALVIFGLYDDAAFRETYWSTAASTPFLGPMTATAASSRRTVSIEEEDHVSTPLC